MRNNAVSMVRISATFMIVLCHVFSWIGINSLAMIFNVGVEIFLLISGYLYSNRKIDSAAVFLKKRWIKLCVPMCILVVCLFLYNLLVIGNWRIIKMLPIYILNLQGIGFVIPKLHVSNMAEIGQLWFITVIMLCYIFLVFVKKIETDKFWKCKWKVYDTYVILLIVDLILVLNGIQIAYFVVFFIGYAIGKMNVEFKNTSYIILSVTMICVMGVRLIARNIIDGSVLYDNVITIMAHTVLGIWIYATICLIYERFKCLFDMVCNSTLWNWLEKHSMMIYMTHYMFLIGNFNVANLPIGIGGQFIAFGIFTILASMILNYISEKIINWWIEVYDKGCV